MLRKRVTQKEYKAAEELRSILLNTPEEFRKRTVVAWLAAHNIIAEEEDVIILKDCIPVLRDKTTFDYPISRLEWIFNSISTLLHKYSRPFEVTMSAEHVDKHYSREKGWDGKEGMPWTIAEAWDRYGFVDFRGHDVSDPAELAALWSIYCNPLIEYSHIVLLKGGQIVHQTMMTAGVSLFTQDSPSGGIQNLKKRYEEIDYDSIYILHNHPADERWPSASDLKSAKTYQAVFGEKFKGSLVLEGKGYHLIEPENLQSDRQEWKQIPYKTNPHHVPDVPLISDKPINSGTSLGIWAQKHKQEIEGCIRYARKGKPSMAIALLNSDGYLMKLLPFNAKEYSPAKICRIAIENMGASCMLLTDSRKEYETIKKRIRSLYGRKSYQPILDCVLIDPEKTECLKETGLFESEAWSSFLSSKEENRLIKDKKYRTVFDAGTITIKEAIRRQEARAKAKGGYER